MFMLRVTASKGYAEIEIKIPKPVPPTKDLWILCASKLIWEIWSKMGWRTFTSHFIRKDDWWSLEEQGKKCEVMMKIERLIKISRFKSLDAVEKYELTLKMISELVRQIEDLDIKLENCSEVSTFRKFVAHILLLGTLRGLDTKSAIPMDRFCDPICKEFLDNQTTVSATEHFLFTESKETVSGNLLIETDNSLYIPPFSYHIHKPELL